MHQVFFGNNKSLKLEYPSLYIKGSLSDPVGVQVYFSQSEKAETIDRANDVYFDTLSFVELSLCTQSQSSLYK